MFMRLLWMYSLVLVAQVPLVGAGYAGDMSGEAAGQDWGGASERMQASRAMPANEPTELLSVQALRAYCGSGAPCGSDLACEGQLVRLFGQVDGANIWERSRYPWLPAEKFFLRDQHGAAMIEVRVEMADSSAVFKELRAAAGNSSQVFLHARVIAIDLPVMQDCRREIVLVLERQSSLSVGDELR